MDTTKKTNITITRDLIDLINNTAQATVSAAACAEDINYFHATEKLLYNYKRLEALVANKQEYLELVPPRVSTSLVRIAPSSDKLTAPEPLEQFEQDRAISYKRTKSRFDEIAQVVKLFEDKKEFIVIRMYYFNEDSQGNPRPEELRPYTWEDMVYELSVMEVLHDTKTARRWRNRIVNDMAICLFGKPAAINSGRYASKGT